MILKLHNECFISLNHLVPSEFSRFYRCFVCLCVLRALSLPKTAPNCSKLTINFERNSQIISLSETDLQVSATSTFMSMFSIYDTLVKRPPEFHCWFVGEQYLWFYNQFVQYDDQLIDCLFSVLLHISNCFNSAALQSMMTVTVFGSQLNEYEQQ